MDVAGLGPIIKVLYTEHYEVAAPSSVGAAKLDVVAKYQEGRLPPDFGKKSVGSAGFTLQIGDIGIF